MKHLVFNVMVPAMMAGPRGEAIPDKRPNYVGSMVVTDGAKVVNIANARVTLGTKIGNKWMGCTYVAPPYVVNGFGVLEEVGV